MNVPSITPYVVGQWVRGKRFYGRQSHLQEILAGPRESLWLLGTRRIGKTSLLRQQDALVSARGQVVSNLIATYKALGGGWQLRAGDNFVRPDTIDTMKQRTDWGELLTASEP